MSDHIEWWTEPADNALHYQHRGCDTPPGKWIVPLDDCPTPTEKTQECAHCCHIRPLVQRDQALRDQGWEYNQEHGGFQRVPKP